MFLEAFRRRRDAHSDDAFPWTIPALRDLRELRFTGPVTILMGENGCGKSTLLEAIAVAVEAAAAGPQGVDVDATLSGSRRLAAAFETVERGRPRVRTFFRAEDAFDFTKRIAAEIRRHDAEADPEPDDEGSGLLRGGLGAYVTRTANIVLLRQYGADPHARSHGETFLGIVKAHLVTKSLYLLDEPETPLSPTRVLALLALLLDAVAAGSQFVIATHSPILAAFPGASIRVFDANGITETPYEDLEHVRVTRDFLNDPERYLRSLTMLANGGE